MSKEGRVVVTAEDIDHDRESTWRKTGVIIVVLLLVLFSMTWLFTRPYFEPDIEEEEYPWKVPAEPLVISEDTTWTDQTMTLDQPLVIKEGATLRIEGSQITVDLLDLVFWQRPAIRVHDGGSLELVDSHLEVDRDDRTTTAVFGHMNLVKHRVPNIARLVNLGNATDPTISFEYLCRNAQVPIAIGVQPEQGGDFEVVHIFFFEDSYVNSWTTVSYSLEEYAGTRPQVVIYPYNFPEGLMFISDLRIQDGDAAPQGDWFRTGHPGLDGWKLDGFGDLGWAMETSLNGSHYSLGFGDLWKGLIEADGDVTLDGSSVVAPDDLKRQGPHTA